MAHEDTLLHNPLEELTGYRLRRASARLMGDLARDLSDLGLKPTEASILLLIAANPGVTQSEIGRLLGIQRANMAPLTKGLDARGLIRRDRVDGRSHGLAATNTGEELCRVAHIVMVRHDARFLALLNESTRSTLIEALLVLDGPTNSN